MLYIINIVFSCIYLSFIRIRSWRDIVKVLPVILLWSVIAGGQDNIGVDYPMYLSYFNNPSDAAEDRFEWLFAVISGMSARIGLNGQWLFFIFAFINIVLLFIGGRMARIKHWAIYYFLIITVAVIFNNQMNALRQTTAVCFCFMAFIAFFENKMLGIALLAAAMGFHLSAIICFAFLWIRPILKFTSRFPLALLAIAFISGFIDTATQEFNNSLLELIPDFMADDVRYVEAYTDSEYSHSTDMIYRLSKIIQIPLYWKSLMLLKKNVLTRQETNLFNLGFLSFALRNLLLINTLVGRLSYYFWIPSLFPLYYLMRYYWIRKQYIAFTIIVLWCIVPYIAKIIVGTQNYGSTYIWGIM